MFFRRNVNVGAPQWFEYEWWDQAEVHKQHILLKELMQRLSPHHSPLRVRYHDPDQDDVRLREDFPHYRVETLKHEYKVCSFVWWRTWAPLLRISSEQDRIVEVVTVDQSVDALAVRDCCRMYEGVEVYVWPGYMIHPYIKTGAPAFRYNRPSTKKR